MKINFILIFGNLRKPALGPFARMFAPEQESGDAAYSAEYMQGDADAAMGKTDRKGTGMRFSDVANRRFLWK